MSVLNIHNGVLYRSIGPLRCNLVIPEGVTAIGSHAFIGNTAITSVTFPESLKSIGPSAFQGCTSLQTLHIPDGVTTIDRRAFEGCNRLQSVTIGSGVRFFGTMAFDRCINLKTVTVKQGVTALGEWTFAHCFSLEEVTLPQGLTELNEAVFLGCSSLKAIVLPQGLETIGPNCFRDCSVLDSVTFPSSVTAINKNAFAATPWLLEQSSAVIVNHLFYSYRNPTETVVTVPEGITDIAEGAFRFCENLTTIHLPDSLKRIGEDAFGYCPSLSSLTIPKGVVSIGEDVFRNCPKLTRLKFLSAQALNSCWKTLGESKRLAVIKTALFEEDVTDFLLPKIKANKKMIVDTAIRDNDGQTLSLLFSLFKRLSLSELNRYIEQAANAPSAQAVILKYKAEHYPADVQERLETKALEKELGLRKRTMADWKTIYGFTVSESGVTIKKYKQNDAIVQIPDRIGKHPVTTIDTAAFSAESIFPFRPKALEVVMIPSTVVMIGTSAFHHCVHLHTVDFQEGLKIVCGWAFCNCKELTSIRLPEGTIQIFMNAFAECSKLTEIHLPDSVYLLSEKVFSGCSHLKSVRIPKGVTVLERQLFASCTALTAVYIHEGVTEIHPTAFLDCPNLTIYGKENSVAHQFALRHNLPFQTD